ncbi:Ku protein [Streptomyces sp. NRRL F-5135]|uniref:non-homologous end joining protein Ku n=1 Tax=Streptomyces sp. NRRL F-5135 TaxID=1463858 RepID=UPI0004C6261F|nr:Ku protein [Streptomyces sp. NRRL F-5135]
MARPLWNGVLSFGLVSLPVRLYSATESHTVRFHQLQRGTSDRVRNRRVNERTGEEVPLDEIVKGLDAGDEYVLVEPDELDDIAPGRSRALEIGEFVDLDQVDPIFFDRTYYLGPRGEEYAKVYALLREALERSNKAGIATFVMRSREYLVAVRAEGDVLALHTLHWADEVRDPASEVGDLPEGRKAVSGQEREMALRLVETMTTDWDPGAYHDTYQERVRRLVEAKRSGETVEKAEEPPESTNVVDLMSALRASVDSARSSRGAGTSGSGRTRRRADGRPAGQGEKHEAEPPKRQAEKRAKNAGEGEGEGEGDGRRRGGRTAKRRPEPLADLSKTELYRRATEAGVPGRSSMTRQELLEALSAGEPATASRRARRTAKAS